MVDGELEGGNGATGEKPAWLAQLPADLKDNPSFTSYKTIGDLAKDHLALGDKAKEIDGLKEKLENYIPKLAEDSTDEEKNLYYSALGRPEKPDKYEFEGDNLDPKTVDWARDTFFKAGLNNDQAKAIAGSWNGFMKQMIDAEAESRGKEREAAETKLKSELGEKYNESIEMVKRVWKKLTDDDFDKFVDETKIGNDPRLIRFMIKVSKTVGEDKSPSPSPSLQTEKSPGLVYDKSPELFK